MSTECMFYCFYQLSGLFTTLLHGLMVVTHNVHRPTALSDAVCVNDIPDPAQHPRI